MLGEMLSVLQQSAWTELYVIVQHKTSLEVIFRVRTGDLDTHVGKHGVLLRLKDLRELLSALS